MRLIKTIAVLAVLIAPAAHADDFYLELDGIPGESKAAGHRNWIDILRFEHGADVPGDAGPDEREGRPTFRELRLCKYRDKSSFRIMRKYASGKTIQTAKFEIVSEGNVVFRYEFSDVVIRRFGRKGETPKTTKECFSLTFRKVTVTQITYDEDGKPSEEEFEWDTESNSVN